MNLRDLSIKARIRLVVALSGVGLAVAIGLGAWSLSSAMHRDIAAQTRRVMDNLAAVLKSAGLSFADVARTTIFLADMNDFAKVNEVYGTYFSEPYPARATVQVARLPKDARVEIDAIASFSK